MILKLKRTPAIYLVGFMGCGKSTVGRALADELGWSFFDLDEEIERRESTTIAEIFDGRGEEQFREIETAVLRERVHFVQSGRPQVIALGGGAFLREDNFELVSNNGVTVWLDCLFSMIERRVSSATHRPRHAQLRNTAAVPAVRLQRHNESLYSVNGSRTRRPAHKSIHSIELGKRSICRWRLNSARSVTPSVHAP